MNPLHTARTIDFQPVGFLYVGFVSRLRIPLAYPGLSVTLVRYCQMLDDDATSTFDCFNGRISWSHQRHQLYSSFSISKLMASERDGGIGGRHVSEDVALWTGRLAHPESPVPIRIFFYSELQLTKPEAGDSR